MATGGTKFSLKLQKKKSKGPKKRNDDVLKNEFRGDDQHHDETNGSHHHDASRRQDEGPLVIPVGENKLKWKQQKETLNKEDAEAVKALEEKAQGGGGGTAGGDSNNNQSSTNKQLVIAAGRDSFQHKETQQYKADLEELPEELSLDSESYQRVPIGDFGTALLRGMGWTGEDDRSNKKDDDTALPRPHRLGLGATPKLELSTHNAGRRRPDQVKRQEALEAQQKEYALQREKQRALDKQRTLQDGSLVQLTRNRRARIVQLVGVPGLNMVKVAVEGDPEAVIIKRGQIERLLSREEIEHNPFKDGENKKTRERKEDRKEEDERWSRKDDDRRRKERREGPRRESDRKRGKDKVSREDDEQRQSKRQREESSSKPQWIIPNIRVRVITEKLGRRHFKEKGIVVDVTPKGATLKMMSGSVLDRVPERYLETALPKPGGKAVVLTGDHRFTKGELLERNSRTSRGVIQAYEDMNVLTLSLDDIAEWCGPLDDDLA